jgi:hypothetical protein
MPTGLRSNTMTDEQTPGNDGADQGAQPAEQSSDRQGNGDKPEITFTRADLDRIVRERLDRERKKYADYGELREKAAAAKTTQEQLDELRQQFTQQQDEWQQQQAKRDEQDIERAGKTAHTQLRAALLEHGIKVADIDQELLPDPVRLLKNGEPDDKAITKFATALAKVAGRPAPDPDQGQKGGDAPTDMNALIRRAAGRA